MVSVNELGVGIAECLIDASEELNVNPEELGNGSTVIDCGVDVRGGYEAGRLLAEVCMGGLGTNTLAMDYIDDTPMPFVHVETDHPSVALLGSQKAGWQVSVGDYYAMGSGPARALALKPRDTYEKIGYEDDYDEAVVVLEADELPNEDVMEEIAEEAGVEVGDTYALVAPTASIAGSVQVAARIVETTVYRLNELGYDTRKVVSGAGSAPVPPVKPGEAMGTTNDAQIYYGNTCLTVEDEDVLDYLDDVPSENASDYGKPFWDTFEEAGYDFYEIDTAIFAPAEVSVNVLETGEVAKAGGRNLEVIKDSFGL